MNKESVKEIFISNGLSSFECDITLMQVLGLNKIQLFLYDKDFDKAQINAIYKVLKKRKKGKPLDLIFSQSNFFGYNFYVNKNVLKPRGDSEILVDQVMKTAKCDVTILDLCCGSGCIGLSIAKELKKNNIIANLMLSDISNKALKIATKNAKILGVECKIIKSDLFGNVEGQFDIIVCNPPYIKTDVIETLGREVKKYDPKIALDGGKDGLVFYKNICNQAKKFMKSGGILFLEIGFDQKEEIKKVFSGWQIKFVKDFSGIDRVAVIRMIQADGNSLNSIVTTEIDDHHLDSECISDREEVFDQYFEGRKQCKY